jgi:hypothetical protein
MFPRRQSRSLTRGVRSSRRAAAVALLLACGTEPPPPGALTIALADIPTTLANTSVAVTGTVTRTPPLAVAITVRATGGAAPAEVVAAADGAFTLNVSLTPNAVATITVTAADSTGSTSNAPTVQVRQDSRGPNVVAMTPANATAGLPPNQAVVVTFDEAVDPAHLELVTLQRGGVTVQPSITLTPDSLSMTITPSAGASGALFQVTINGVRDALGNVQGALASRCYMTAPPAGTSPIVDPSDDIYYAGQIGTITPSDFVSGSVSQTGGMVDVLLRFTTPRVVRATGDNGLLAAVDLDYDGLSSTGWRPIKDVIFDGVLPQSGAGADYGIWLGPFSGSQSVWGRYTAEAMMQILGAFDPAACGTTVGFTLDNSQLGLPGTFNLVGYFETSDANGGLFDAAPDTGVYPVTLVTAGPAAAAAASHAPASGVTARFPLRRLFR